MCIKEPLICRLWSSRRNISVVKCGSCIPIQLSILFNWQAKSVCPFIPTILYIFYILLNLFSSCMHRNILQLGEKQQRVNQTNEESTILTCQGRHYFNMSRKTLFQHVKDDIILSNIALVRKLGNTARLCFVTFHMEYYSDL